MKLAALALLLLVACTASTAGDPPPPPQAALLRVVTWNVHDLFDEVDRTASPGSEDEVLTSTQLETKLARVGRVLAALDGDLLVLQEVENVALLEALAAGPLGGRGYLPLLREGADPRGIDVGVLARVPFRAGPSHLDELAEDGRRLWSRDVLEVHLRLGGRELVVLGAHLVSRLDPADDGRRREQAARIRQIADTIGAGPERPSVLVVGDLNDIAGSSTLAPLLADGGFQDLGASLPTEQGWTWAGGGSHQRIDYALISRRDAGSVTRVEVDAAPDVATASDHRPLLVDLWATPPE
jgi:endonuclease/exonuclease/phosphatase family metal-dependent hydrolase